MPVPVLEQIRKHLTARRWDQPYRGGNWWDSPPLWNYVNSLISSDGGVAGALKAFGRFERGVSVGCGKAVKERNLMRAGIVWHFDLYELSPNRASAAKRAIAAEGLHATVHIEDAFTKRERYDLVHWDHALHHMSDVACALDWSLQSLNPGGVLVVNDYVGPSRLQYPRRETEFARRFLRDHGLDPRRIRSKNLLTRAAMIWRDPSEAPQSHLIMALFKERCGVPMKPLGGAMIHRCAPHVTHLEHQNPIYAALIEWDREALACGMCHFGFGMWQK